MPLLWTSVKWRYALLCSGARPEQPVESPGTPHGVWAFFCDEIRQEHEQQLIARDETTINRLLVKWGRVHSLLWQYPLFGSYLLPRYFLPGCRGFSFLRIQSVDWYSTATSILQKALSLTAVTALISLVRQLEALVFGPPEPGLLFVCSLSDVC